MYQKDPLEGIKILDFTQVLSGPFTTMLLGDLGAEVIKVEMPGMGDSLRKAGPPFQKGESAYFFCCNRNKKSISVDLKKKEGVELIGRLVKTFDVMAENFRPGVMERLGLGYEAMKKIKPDLIYASLTAFGNKGPYKDRPGFELIVQGMTGLVSVTTEPGCKPAKIQPQIVDLSSGIFLALAVLGALYHKQRTGEGQKVETTLLESAVTMMANLVGIHLMGSKVPTGMRTRNPQMMPSQAFRTKDHFINIVCTSPHWERFCIALEKKEWVVDPKLREVSYRIEHYDEMEKMVEKVTTTKTTREWLEIFEKHQVAAGPINTVEELFQDPQFKCLNMVVTMNHPRAGRIQLLSQPWKMSATPGRMKLPPPMLGEHTTHFLMESGLTLEEIEDLKEKKVIFGQ